MKVFRIEDSEGIGPFNTDQAIEWDVQHFCSTKHPKAEEDRLLRKELKERDIPLFSYDHLFFGFATMNQVLDWFDQKDHWEALANAGFSLVEYECSDVLHGEVQVMFERYNVELTKKTKTTALNLLPIDVWFQNT